MPRLPASARPLIFGLSMAFLYAGPMSGIFTWKALGSDWSLPVWLRAWALAFAIAAPAGLVLRPVAAAMSRILTES